MGAVTTGSTSTHFDRATVPSPPSVRGLHYFVSVTSLFSIVIGLLGLVGWTFGIAVLKSVVPGNVVIKPNAAVSFVLIGISLWLLKENREQRSRRAWRLCGRALAALTALVGFLSLGEYLFGWNLGIDQLLFHEGAADAFGSIRPGLMAPICALEFVLLGAALLLLDRSVWGRNWFAQFLALVAGITAIFGLLDFILDPLVSQTHSALQSVFTFFLLSSALILARTEWGLGALFVSSSPGGALARRLFPAAIVFPMMIGWIRWLEIRESLWIWISVTTVLSVVLLAALIVWTALVIDRADRQRQRSAKALHRSERLYRMLFENLVDGFAYCRLLFDEKGRPEDFVYIEINSTFERLTGLEHMAGKRATEAIPGIKGSYAELFEIYCRVALTGAAERFEFELRPVGRWLSVSVYSPEHEYFVAVFDDISERKRSEHALRELAAIVESSQDAIVGATLDGTVTSWNAGAERLYHYEAREAIGKSITFLARPGQERELQDAFFRARGGEPDFNVAMQWRRKDGTVADVSLTTSPIRNDAGQLVGVSAITHDVTDRNRAEEQLRLQAAALTATANSIVITDCGGQILWVNPAFTKLTGYEASEVIGQYPRVLKSGQHDRAFYEQMWKTVLDGLVWQGEIINRRKDGSCYREEMTITPVRSTSGEIRNFVAIKQDITSRNSLELQLRQSQKMEAVGRLAGGIAHDFNNMLMIIAGYGELLREHLAGDERSYGMTNEILKAANRAASLTRQLLAFSRKQLLLPRVLDLNSVLAELGRMLHRLIGEDVDLKIVPGVDLGHVKADASQIQQVIMNLVVNARDAMPSGGRLTIETMNAELDETYGRLHAVKIEPGQYVMLSVSDSGVGMDRETQSHIFEPFFTTKDVDKGTGLGLSIVYGVVKQSGGFIWVYSEPGQGTTFKIYLPRIEDREKGTPAISQLQKSHRGSETILVAEDESGVREAIRDFLQIQGYTVLEAQSPKVALEISEAHAGPIHLLMTDMIMPEMNGLELAARLKTSRPEMKMLYVSGYTDRGIGGGATIDADMNFLQKPFAFEVLGRRLRDILER